MLDIETEFDKIFIIDANGTFYSYQNSECQRERVEVYFLEQFKIFYL